MRYLLVAAVILTGVWSVGFGQSLFSGQSLWRLWSRGKTPSVSELKKRQSLLAKKQRQARKKIRMLRKTERSLSERLEATRERIAVAKKKLHQLEVQQRSLQTKMAITRQRIIKVRARLSHQRSLLAERLRQIYRMPPVHYVLFVFDAPDLEEASTRTYTLSKVLEHDSEMITETKNAHEELTQLEQELKEQERQVAQVKEATTREAQRLRQAQAEQKTLLRKVQRDRLTYEQFLREWEEESRLIGQLLFRLQKERLGRPRVLPPWRGPFARPVAGRLVSGFGYRVHPIYRRVKFHYGVDLAAPHGSPIYAAADGEVVYSGWRRAYGNTVIIDHGDGLATLYAHCSAILVREGQIVRKGQVIARVGSTGLSTGPHLHFEVRRFGQPMNPLSVR
ncbi:MAG: peptidoglycan DD-metalloendopeptidase family protein [Armatimonadetes bacterium]|nr:peptidoglycan DD-metalloendopeptidase family protein [Armatimonadota bacterium]MDW8122271.1 peptidoglycan DD-metalloendopeptidase family protein [Armatimonadota bacterium]